MYNKTFKFLGLTVGLFVGAFFLMPTHSFAQTNSTQALTGTLSSANIGTIYLNSTDPGAPAGGVNASGQSAGSAYQVEATTSGSTVTLSGYGWSPSLGWIGFNASDLAGCPAATPITIPVAGGNLSGYARALAGSTTPTAQGGAGGWSGCISVSDAGGMGGLNATDPYQVTYSGSSISGTGWGSPGSSCQPPSASPSCQVIGWVTFNATLSLTTPVLPAVDFSVNSPGTTSVSIPSGSTVTLEWNVQALQAGSCMGTSSGAFTNWNNTVKTSSPDGTYTEVIPNITTSRTYTMQGCTPSGGGSALPAQTVTITVTTTAACSVVPVSSTNIFANSNGSVNGSAQYGVSWSGIGSSYYSTNITASSGNGLTVSVSNSPVTSAASSATVTVTGTMNAGNSPYPVIIDGVPTQTPPNSCTSSVLSVYPPSYCQQNPSDPACQGTTSGGIKGLPWEEI